MCVLCVYVIIYIAKLNYVNFKPFQIIFSDYHQFIASGIGRGLQMDWSKWCNN